MRKCNFTSIVQHCYKPMTSRFLKNYTPEACKDSLAKVNDPRYDDLRNLCFAYTKFLKKLETSIDNISKVRYQELKTVPKNSLMVLCRKRFPYATNAFKHLDFLNSTMSRRFTSLWSMNLKNWFVKQTYGFAWLN